MNALGWIWLVLQGWALLAWLGITWRLWQTQRCTPTLEAPAAAPEAGMDGAPWPLLSVIVPARNEAPHVEAALRSLLAQDYPALEVVAVDDRSTDGTGAILERLAAAEPRLTVVHLEHLPQGWLGKNHAVHQGAARARGAWLLFADADIVFQPGALRAAVAFAEGHGVGHLVASPRLVAPGWWERAQQATFGLYFLLRCQVWDLRRPGTAAHVGMGAFNLVRRTDYDRVGGHTRLALSVVDDVRLGLLLRRSGVPQALVGGRDLISVRWQPGFWATLGGMLKNAFADMDYRWLPTLGAALGLLWLGVLPPAGLLWAPAGPLPYAAARWLALGAVIVPLALHGVVARRMAGGSGWEGVAYPVTHAALAGVLVLSALLATLRGGLVWRGTAYPLATLRAGTLRTRDLPRSGAVGW